jgi:hypothetical protein
MPTTGQGVEGPQAQEPLEPEELREYVNTQLTVKQQQGPKHDSTRTWQRKNNCMVHIARSAQHGNKQVLMAHPVHSRNTPLGWAQRGHSCSALLS